MEEFRLDDIERAILNARASAAISDVGSACIHLAEAVALLRHEVHTTRAVGYIPAGAQCGQNTEKRDVEQLTPRLSPMGAWGIGSTQRVDHAGEQRAANTRMMNALNAFSVVQPHEQRVVAAVGNLRHLARDLVHAEHIVYSHDLMSTPGMGDRQHLQHVSDSVERGVDALIDLEPADERIAYFVSRIRQLQRRLLERREAIDKIKHGLMPEHKLHVVDERVSWNAESVFGFTAAKWGETPVREERPVPTLWERVRGWFQ